MKKLLLSIGLALSTSGVFAAAPVFWDPVGGGNGHYYEIVRAQGISWTDARVSALGMFHNGLQAHLATVTSDTELAFLIANLNGLGLGEMYVGGYQNPPGTLDAKAGWTWVNGEGTFGGVNNYPGMPGYDSTKPFSHWAGGEPNDAYGPGSEQYLGINFGGGLFNDEGNLNLIYGYIVEYDPTTINDVPEAASTMLLLLGAMGVVTAVRRIRL